MKKTLYAIMTLCAASAAYAQTPTPAPVPETAPVIKIQSPTTIQFEVTEHDFGNIKEGETVSYTFKFTNTGTTPLELENVSASCGCTTPNWSRGPYAPGASGEITATYNSMGKGVGAFSKTITVYSNAGKVELYIRGTANPANSNTANPGSVSPAAPASVSPAATAAPAVVPAAAPAEPAKPAKPAKAKKAKTAKPKN